MRPAEREVVQNELNQVQSEREQQRQQILAEKIKLLVLKWSLWWLKRRPD